MLVVNGSAGPGAGKAEEALARAAKRGDETRRSRKLLESLDHTGESRLVKKRRSVLESCSEFSGIASARSLPHRYSYEASSCPLKNRLKRANHVCRGFEYLPSIDTQTIGLGNGFRQSPRRTSFCARRISLLRALGGIPPRDPLARGVPTCARGFRPLGPGSGAFPTAAKASTHQTRALLQAGSYSAGCLTNYVAPSVGSTGDRS